MKTKFLLLLNVFKQKEKIWFVLVVVGVVGVVGVAAVVVVVVVFVVINKTIQFYL
jgi:hypothetical protein